VPLYQFQQELVDKLGNPNLPGRLIADEMGCGKTYEGIAIEKRLRDAHTGAKLRTLIVAPWSVHIMWQRKLIELLGVAPRDIVVIDRKHRAAFLRSARIGQAKYYIIHYEALRIKDMEPLQRIQWFHIIADEIHRVKSPHALQTKAFKRLRTQFKTGMSGSMADDKPQDFWSPLHWVRPDLFPNVSTKDPTKKFVQTYCVTEEIQGRVLKDADGEPRIDPETGEELHQIHHKVVGMKQERLAEFHQLIAPFYMRRLKEDVLDLPPKYFTPINVKLHPSQKKVYGQLKREFMAWIGEHEDEQLSVPTVLGRLVRLQQAALASLMFYDTGKVDPRTKEPILKVKLREPSAKLDAFMDWAADIKGPVVVFSQSRGMIDLAAARLDAAGARIGVYTGSTPDKMRQPIIDNFQAGKLDFFLGTIKAGGEGITLTTSSTMAFFDRAWGPFRNKQAEDREHREGQKNAVQIVDFFAPGTVDAKVRNTNIVKWSHLKAILGDNREEA
jgi:SNF2 family DNA or RNA helicase